MFWRRFVHVVLMNDYVLGVYSSRDRADWRFEDAKRRRESLGETWHEVSDGVWATEHVRRLEIQARRLNSN
jgi:hypothetical protein